MTPEQMERTIQFILEHQAQLTASLQKHDEVLAQLERNVARHDQEIQTVTDLIGRLAVAETRLVERIDTFDERMNRLAQAQAETTERLNAFITFVEKYISSRNGGGTPGSS